MAWDTSCNCEFIVYYDSMFSIFTGNTMIKKSLSSIVDINSFVWVDSTDYSKDKNNVFYFYANSDGGNRIIVDKADPKTFKRLCEYRWGVDKNFVFYENNVLLKLNPKKIQILYSPDTSNHFVSYIKDNKIVYYEDEILKGADVKTFKISGDEEWKAEDKNYKYKGAVRQ